MITAVDFVSVNVSDQDRAKRFYVDVLGFEEVTDVAMGDPDGPRWIEVRPPGGSTRVVLFLDAEKGGGFGPCVFDTDDIVRTCDEIAEHGGIVSTAPKLEAWGSWWAEIQDSEGNTFGLGQRSRDSSSAGTHREAQL